MNPLAAQQLAATDLPSSRACARPSAGVARDSLEGMLGGAQLAAVMRPI